MNQLPELDNFDRRIRYYELVLEGDISHIPVYTLPEGYHFTFYQDGDRDAWIEIEISAKQFRTYAEGLESWNRYYLGREQELKNRMLFLETEGGEKVATATAFYDITGRDASGDAWLHWVAIRREHQGKGLSKPLLSQAFSLMRGLGKNRAKIPTQTTTWLACKVYLDFGFRPVPQNAENSRDGWRILKRLTNHPSLSQFDMAEDWEVLKQQEIENA